MLIKLSSLYTAQLLKAVLPLLFIPLIIVEVGIQQYGLVSFMLLMMSFLGLLDAGISGGMVRVLSISKTNIEEFTAALKLWLNVFLFIMGISVLIFLLFFVGADFLASSWFEADLSLSLMNQSLIMIGVILSLTFLKGYLTSKLVGFEKQIQLSVWQVVITTCQYIIPYYILKIYGSDVDVYLAAVAFFCFIDCLVMYFLGFFYSKNIAKKLSSYEEKVMISSDISRYQFLGFVKNCIHLSGLTIIWTVSTQIDKLVLSKYVSMETFSYYQIAAQVALSVNLVIMPLNQFLMPRLASLYSSSEFSNYSELIIRFFTFFVLFFALFTPMYFSFGKYILSFWLADITLTENVHVYLKWLLYSAVIQSFSNFIFLFYYSTNRLNRQFHAYLIYSSITIPGSIFIAIKYGAEACAIFSLVSSFLFFIVWGSITLNSYFKKFQLKMFFLPIIVFAASSLFLQSANFFLRGEYLKFQIILFSIFYVVVFYFICRFIVKLSRSKKEPVGMRL
ncbi:oligosaccharide flippase family protein [Alishewanella sp. 16-MA]|uniref:Oligosaccharide flippase family protein n=1 Tax=Alishewanella maricola TaxID=2795740 RepID=A0ABS8C160_9ALTE|nr:oligosaccharide flippase family protein [Alishewanella maricola]MCB5226068.1 oligosaccharide flippase family protein [Alishewanella maricola]